MNITDIKLKYAAAGAATVVKTATDMAGLQTILAPGAGETTLNGAGPYYEVKVNDGTNNYTLNVPALTLGLGSTGLYVNGVNKVSAIAKELLAKYYETHPTTFDLVAYQSERRTALNAEITAEASSTTPDKKKIKRLKKELKDVEKLKEKDINEILTTQVTGLETKVNTGVDVAGMTPAQIKTALTKYLKENAMKLEEKKVQKANNPKKSRLQVFSGIKTFLANNKTIIATGAVITALAATGVTGVVHMNKYGKDKDNSNDLPQQPAIIVQVPTGVTINSPEFTAAVAANMTKYAPYRDTLSVTSDFSYEEIIRGYTFIEQCPNMDTQAMNGTEIGTLICAGDCLVVKLCRNNQFGNISPEARQAINGGTETSVTFIEQNNAMTGGTLLDYMTVGRYAGLRIQDSGDSTMLYDYNTRIYTPGLSVYETFLDNGLNLGANLGQQKTLGAHPATRINA